MSTVVIFIPNVSIVSAAEESDALLLLRLINQRQRVIRVDFEAIFF